MNDLVIGQYLSNVFQGNTVNITFEQTILPNGQGTLTMADAEDSATLSAKIGAGGDIYLLDSFSYADPGFVRVSLLPDGESSRKTKIDAHKNATRIPFPIPILIAVDISLEYLNGAAANNLYVNLTGISFSQDNSIKFQDWCSTFMDALQAGGQNQGLTYGMPGYVAPGQGTGTRDRCRRTRG